MLDNLNIRVNLRFLFFALYAAFLLCASYNPQESFQASPLSFSQSKVTLQKAYKEQDFREEFYCGGEFEPDTLRILPSKDYTPRNALTKANKPNVRAQRIEFERTYYASPSLW